MRWFNKVAFYIAVSFLVLCPTLAMSATCKGRFINPSTDVCWSCLFPISIGAMTTASSDLPDTDNPSNPICICEWDPFPEIGISVGYWEPMALIDVTRTPYCMVNLGTQFSAMSEGQGAVDSTNPEQTSSFYYVHYYNFPVLRWIGSKLLGGRCQAEGGFNIPYFSELDPTWRDSALAAIAFPESQILQDPITNLACAADSLKANTGLPADSTFWCMGSQGLTYPMSGFVAEHIGGVQASTLLAERAVFKLHRVGIIRDSSPKDLCGESFTPLMSKSRYRYQMIHPSSEQCHPFGRTTAIWGAGKENPLEGDDAGFLIWRKKNCCNY